jgi:5-methylcytosine-specific restriction endonuclease McrA
VTIDKSIPIELSEHEIAKYTDDWNFCFGGNINKTREDDKVKVYHVKVYTD